LKTKLGIFLYELLKDIDYIAYCIQLAKKGEGNVDPNPLVGCVIVHEDHIISEGYHAFFGGPHAEPNAILPIIDDPRLSSSTLYVTLEPCSHHGKTPPCADLIVDSGIKKVFVAMRDPNPNVAGKGIAKLRNAGIQVTVGIGEDLAERLNPAFLTFQRENIPYFVAKWAETKDGWFAPETNSKKWISGPDTQPYVHALRKKHMSILIGVGTWQTDSPLLNDRFHGGPDPLRLIWDPENKGNYPPNLISKTAKTWVLNRQFEKESERYHYVQIQNLYELPQYLYSKQINSVLVEGGAHTINAFFKLDLIDEVHRFTSKYKEWGAGLPSPKISDGFELIDTKEFESDTLEIWKNK
jgi:diaminohydroxyphosphoribosylaminopyrimidine deaminase / 5-amino-6-(5-phosphoribosylamino)uracil reductase